MIEIVLSIFKILSGGLHITIEMRSEVVESILRDIVPSGLGSLGAEFPLVSEIYLSLLDGGSGIKDIIISTEVWNSVVDWVSKRGLLVLVLGASRR